jgi:hypothetical protein
LLIAVKDMIISGGENIVSSTSSTGVGIHEW